MRRLSWLLVGACTAGVDKDPVETDVDADTSAADTDVVCGIEAGSVVSLTDAYPEGTEGVALSPDGRLLITARERTLELDREGAVVAEWPTPGTIGAMWWKDAFWVTSGKDDAGDVAPALVEIKGGTATRHPLTGLRSPNFIVGTPWDTVLIAVPVVADDVDKIYEWDPVTEETTVWSDDVPSPNGLAFSADGSTLYVATTFSPHEGLWTVEVADGEAGAAAELLAFPQGTSPDGIAMEADGSILVALNTGNRLERVSPDGTSTKVADVPFAASVAYGTAGWPACSALVTSLFSPDVFLVGTGVPGVLPD